jgi:DNA polymerase III subunit epsilon
MIMYKTTKVREFKGESVIDFPADYVVLDIETTGLNPSNDEIIELSAIRIIDGVQVDSFSTLIKPMCRINKFITDLTGITNQMVADAPDIESALPQFCTFVGDSVVVGHNVNFDINFIYDNLQRCLNKPFSNEFIDLLRIARKTLPDLENHKLKTLSEHFDIDTTDSHRGLKDCTMTNDCFIQCRTIVFEKYENKESFIKIFSKGKLKTSAKI